jgi:hypothetical protein
VNGTFSKSPKLEFIDRRGRPGAGNRNRRKSLIPWTVRPRSCSGNRQASGRGDPEGLPGKGRSEHLYLCSLGFRRPPVFFGALGFDRSHSISMQRDWIVDCLNVVQPAQGMRLAPGVEDRVFPALKAGRTTISQVECKGQKK